MACRNCGSGHRRMVAGPGGLDRPPPIATCKPLHLRQCSAPQAGLREDETMTPIAPKRRALLAATPLLPQVARALAEWPNRPVRIIVPSAAGGAADFIGRTHRLLPEAPHRSSHGTMTTFRNDEDGAAVACLQGRAWRGVSIGADRDCACRRPWSGRRMKAHGPGLLRRSGRLPPLHHLGLRRLRQGRAGQDRPLPARRIRNRGDLSARGRGHRPRLRPGHQG